MGDGPIRQDPTPASSAAIIDIRALEIECKRIVQEISEKFIDLGIEDHEDEYAADQSGNEDAILEKDDHQFEEDWPALGHALKDIHEILN